MQCSLGLAPEKASRIIVVLEDSHWTTTDPWSIGDIGILDNNQLANRPGISHY